jgi:hypothetical protein
MRQWGNEAMNSRIPIAPLPHCLIASLITVVIACGGGPKDAPAPPTPAEESPVEITEKWRAKHDADYRRDWVSIAGLYPLKPGVNTVGSAKSNAIVVENVPGSVGRFVVIGDKVRFEPAKGASVLQRDQPVTRAVDFNAGADQLDFARCEHLFSSTGRTPRADRTRRSRSDSFVRSTG